MSVKTSPVGKALPGADYTRALKPVHWSKAQVGYRRISLGSILYVGLSVAGWCATTLLAAAGCFAVLFMMAGNGSLSGFFEQLNLLASHYLSAPPPARASFDGYLGYAALATVFLCGLFRRGALISIFKQGGGDGQQSSGS
jgi:hypothetical protein